MNKNYIFIFIVQILIISSCREEYCIQGSGEERSVVLNKDSFNTITISHPIQYSFKKGKEFKVTATSNTNLIKSLVVNNNKGDLSIYFKDGYYCTDIDVDLEIISPQDLRIIFKVFGEKGEDPTTIYTDSSSTNFITNEDTIKIKKP